MKLEIQDAGGKPLATAEDPARIELVYPGRYHRGDVVVFFCDRPGWYDLRLEDTLPETLVFVERCARFVIPFGRMERVCYSPRAFKGRQHLITAAVADPARVALRRNLALNPLDQRGDTGMWPHAHANTETRGETLFAAHNAIDGGHTNVHHYPYPYASWGINKDPAAALTVEFGRPVVVDELVLTLRADYPHDSHWTRGTVQFSDGSCETLDFAKSVAPQRFAITPRCITSLTLTQLIKAEDESPYPALRQLEVFGTVKGDEP